MKKGKRFFEIRRPGGFAWMMAPENPLADEIHRRLGNDLPGSVVQSLLRRAGVLWEVADDVPVSHDPDNLDTVEMTPQLTSAAGEIAEVLRGEIDAEAIEADARGRIDGDFIYRQPGAVQIGRSVKASPNLPEQYFGELAPLGVTTLKAVAPSLGFVPANGLTDWTGWHFVDSPYEDGPTVDVDELETKVWVRPKYRVRSKLEEVAAISRKMKAARKAPEDSPELRLAIDRVSTVATLRAVFVSGARLEVDGERVCGVDRVLPLDEEDDFGEILPDAVVERVEASISRDRWCLYPLGVEEMIRRLEAGEKQLLHALLWTWRGSTAFPIDVWDFVPVEAGDRALGDRRLRFPELDVDAFSAAIIEELSREAARMMASGSPHQVIGMARKTADWLSRTLDVLEASAEGSSHSSTRVQEVEERLIETRDLLANLRLEDLAGRSEGERA